MTMLLPIVFCLVFFKISLGLKAQTYYQNLIPNGSFDTLAYYDTLLDLSVQDSRWTEIMSCGGGLLHLENNVPSLPNFYSIGYTYPQKGKGVYYISSAAGYKAFNDCYSECQNYIQVKLYKVLKQNKKYRGRFYANRIDSSDYATSRIGMYISINKPSPTYLLPNQVNPYISAIPQVQRNFGNQVIDTSAWTAIEGTFIANQGMKYMTLGNFYRLSNTDTIRITNWPDINGCFNEVSGYYIDNLSLVEEDGAEAYKDTSKNYLCVKQGTSKVLGDTAVRPWLQYEWRDKNNTVVGTNRNYTYNAALIENTFFTVRIIDTGEYAFITKAVDTIFIYTSVSPDTVSCQPVGLEEVLADAEKIDMYYNDNSIVFNELHERFTGATLLMKSIDGKMIYKNKIERKKYNYLVNTEMQKGFYIVEIVYQGQSIKRKKIIVE